MSAVITAFDKFYESLDSTQKQQLIEHIVNQHIKLSLEGYDSGRLVALNEGYNSGNKVLVTKGYNSGSTVRLSNVCPKCGK